MAKKVRLTNFARFFIFLVIIVPLAYVGASYINGEDPKENINNLLDKEIFSSGEETKLVDPNPEPEKKDSNESTKVETGQETIEELKSEVNYYKSKVEDLKAEIEKLEKENYKLRQTN